MPEGSTASVGRVSVVGNLPHFPARKERPQNNSVKWLISAEVAAGAAEATADDFVAESLDVEAFVIEHSEFVEPSERRRDKSLGTSWNSNSSNISASSVSSGTLLKAGAAQQAALDRATAEGKRLSSLEAAEDEPLLDMSLRTSLSVRERRQRVLSMVVLWALPVACCVWFAAAVFFPVDAQAAAPALLWTPGASVWVNGTVSFCPRPAICSEGWAQFWLIVAARLSAFAMYPSLLLVFLSKCHAALRFLSRTFVAELLPLSHLHGLHTFHGLVFANLALFHTVTHLVRWGLRGEIGPFLGRWVGATGAIGMGLMFSVTGKLTLTLTLA